MYLLISYMNLEQYITYYRWSEADFIKRPGLPSGRDRLSRRAMTDGEQPSFEIIFEFMQYQKVNVEMVIKRRNVLTMERIKKVIICSAESAPEKDKMVDIMLTHHKSATFFYQLILEEHTYNVRFGAIPKQYLPTCSNSADVSLRIRKFDVFLRKAVDTSTCFKTSFRAPLTLTNTCPMCTNESWARFFWFLYDPVHTVVSHTLLI